MDKVIIDGVDVSECMYYSKKQQIYSATKPLCIMKNCCMLSDSVSLCLDKDCYYKQLQRAKAEIEVLKRELKHRADIESELSTLCEKLELQNGQLKAENERLKEEVKKIGSNFIKKGDYARDLEKELEKHKSKIEHLLSPLTDSDFQDKLQELEQENERLKEECTLYDCGNKEWAIEYKKLEDDYTELIDRLDDISYDKSNYYQALQEIREIAEYVYDPVDKDNDPCYTILTKINEVIGAE